MLSGTPVGWWSLAIDSIDLLERHLQQHRPPRVLELGSGISTLSLAVFLKELMPETSGPLVFSIEQGEEDVAKTTELLEKYGLLDLVKIIHCPLAECEVLGQKTQCYDFDPAKLSEAFGGAQFRFLLIDGPYGDPGCRIATLPRLLDYLEPGAEFLMDDALRDSELDIAEAWASMPEVDVRGVMMVGKGFLTGRVTVSSEG